MVGYMYFTPVWLTPLLLCDLDPDNFPPDASYPGLYTGEYGPTSSAMKAAAESPLALFFYFLPKRLWQTIAKESNRYHRQQIGVRAGRLRANQKKNQPAGKRVETQAEIRARLREAHVAFEPHEYCKLVGLLIARMLCPHKQLYCCVI